MRHYWQVLHAQDAHRLVLSQWQELQARLATIDADSARKQAERAVRRNKCIKIETFN